MIDIPEDAVSVRRRLEDGGVEWMPNDPDIYEDESVDAWSGLEPWTIANDLWEASGGDDWLYLRRLMELLRVSIMDVARKSRINPSSLSLQLSGKRLRSVRVADSIAHAIADRLAVMFWIRENIGRLPDEYERGGDVAMDYHDSVLDEIAQAFGMEVREGEVRARRPLDSHDELADGIGDDGDPDDEAPEA